MNIEQRLDLILQAQNRTNALLEQLVLNQSKSMGIAIPLPNGQILNTKEDQQWNTMPEHYDCSTPNKIK